MSYAARRSNLAKPRTSVPHVCLLSPRSSVTPSCRRSWSQPSGGIQGPLWSTLESPVLFQSGCTAWHWGSLWRQAGPLSCGIRALSCSVWDLVSWPGIEPRPPAPRVLANGLPEKSPKSPFQSHLTRRPWHTWAQRTTEWTSIRKEEALFPPKPSLSPGLHEAPQSRTFFFAYPMLSTLPDSIQSSLILHFSTNPLHLLIQDRCFLMPLIRIKPQFCQHLQLRSGEMHSNEVFCSAKQYYGFIWNYFPATS